ncbi:MAG: AAA family ATPase [Actinomycetota bacterium]
MLPDRLASPTLVGRDEQLAELLETLSRAPSVVVLEGEAGVGKTRLVQEALARVSTGSRRLIGSCLRLREPFPLGPVVHALRGLRGVHLPRCGPLTGALRQLLPELEGSLAPALDPLGDIVAERHRLFRAVVELLESAGPTALVLEDLHWADPLTLEFLAVLLSEMPPHLALVLTYRGEDLPTPIVQLSRIPDRIAQSAHVLRPLDAARTIELVRAILDAPEISGDFGAFVHRCTDGLPFAIEELLRLLQERRDLILRDGRWERHLLEEIEAPGPIRDAVGERVGRLREDSQLAIALVAVLDEDAALPLLRAVAVVPDGRLIPALSEAITSGVLREDGSVLCFRHALARQAVYDTIPGPLRSDLHRRAGLELERSHPDRVASLARHFAETGDLDRWVAHAEAAAAASAALGNHSGAVAFLKDISEAEISTASDRARIAHQLAEAASNGLRHDDAIPVLERLVRDESISRDDRAQLRLDLARLLHQAGRGVDSVRAFTLAAEELHHRPDVAVLALANLGMPGTFDLTMADHMECIERAAGLARRVQDPDVRIFVEVDRAAALMFLGDRRAWRAAARMKRDGATVQQQRQLLRGFLNLAGAAAILGYDQRSRAFLDEAERRMEAARSSRFAGSLAATTALLDLDAGRWEGLEARARAMAAESDAHWAADLDARILLGLLLLATGRVDEAEDRLASSVSPAIADGAIPMAGAASAALARLDLSRGDPSGALRRIEEPLAAVRRKGVWVWGTEVIPAAVDTLVAQERHEEALVLEREFARGLAGRDAPAARVGLEMCRARLVAHDAPAVAGARFGAAAAAWGDMGRAYRAALAHEAAGAAEMASEPGAAASSLRRAFDGFSDMGASWECGRVRARLRKLGIRVERRPGRRAYGTELSPRELEVAELAAGGSSNQEIAGRLFLSVKTVEKHVTSALRKLELATRRELGSALAGAAPAGKK